MTVIKEHWSIWEWHRHFCVDTGKLPDTLRMRGMSWETYQQSLDTMEFLLQVRQ